MNMSLVLHMVTTIVCNRHLQNNVAKKLDSLIGAQSQTRRRLYKAICGTSGVMSCSDIISFEAAVENLQTGELAHGPNEFATYFEHRLLPLLQANAAVGMNKPDWKTCLGCDKPIFFIS